MRKHKNLLVYLRAQGLRITKSKELLIQFFLDNENRHVPFKELQDYVAEHAPEVDRTTVYRNIEKFLALGLIQELVFPKQGKVYQYIFDKKVQHYYICKACGKSNRGNQELFEKIEKALKDVHGFSKADLSVVFYGLCTKCSAKSDKAARAFEEARA